jgi:DNA repair protein RadA/Sms
MFLADRRPGLPGSVVTATLEGVRPLLVEVQALLSDTRAPAPRRAARGLDGARLEMLLAVLAARADCAVGGFDVYASVAGGYRVQDAGSDVSVAIAVASAHAGAAVPEGLVAVGEIGLGGELRQAPQTARRLGEAARLGFRTAVVPASTPDVPGIRLLRAGHIGDVLTQLELR